MSVATMAPQGAGRRAAHFPDRGEERAGLLHHRAALAGKRLPGGGRYGALAGSLEKRGPRARLERGDLAPQGRPGYAERARGAQK
jgi:hypothetical protein